MATLGLILNQFFDRVTQLIQQFQNTGLVLEVNAGAQIQNLIDSAENAFKDALNTAASDLSAQQQQLTSELQSMIDDLQNGLIDDLTSKLQTIANTIPFGNHFPQVSSFSGNVIAQGGDDHVQVTLTGNFPDIGRNGYNAYLAVGSTKITQATKTTQTLTFMVPKSLFKADPAKVTYTPFSVGIPYLETEVLGIIHHERFASFNFNFIVLPPAPGYYVLQTTQLATVRQEVGDSFGNLVWDSSDDDIDEIKGVSMSDGWECIPNTVSYVFTRVQGSQGGDWFDLGNASTPTFAGWHFKTEHHGFGTSGKLTVTLNFRKWKNVSQLQTVSTPNTPLHWGDVHAITVDPTATWKIIFYQFDGSIKEYIASEHTNPYLWIDTAGNSISIKLIPF